MLRIGVLPSFAANWLVPRLQSFHAAYPDVAITLDPRLEASQVGPRGVDAAIRYGSGRWAGLTAERLIEDTLFPACSPAYRDRMAITDLSDFSRCHLLRNSWHPWTPWFQEAGVDLPEPSDSAPYDDAGLMLDAAVAGHGIGLVRKVIAHDALASGQLVRLSYVEVPFDGAYNYVTVPHSMPKERAIRVFGAWVKERLLADFPVTRQS